MSERIFGIRIDDSGSVKKLNELDAGFKKVDGSSAKVDASNKKLSTSSKTLTKTQSQLGSEVDRLKTRYLGVAAAGAALGATVVTSIKQYAAFETAIAEVNTLLGANANIDAYSNSVRELSKQFGSSNVEQAGAMYQIISAGASDAADATNILTAANKLAIGGVTDVETAADGLTSVLNAYGLASSEASTVSDILFSTMRSGKTTIGELSTSLGKVAPIASQMGVGFDELSAAIGTITTNGVKTTEAVTQVKAALSNILKPTAEAKKLADELGINFSSAGLKANGLAGFLDIVSESTGGSSDQLATLFGSVEAVQAVMPLAGAQADKFNEILLKTKDSAGQTEEAYNIMAETLGKNFDRLKANVGDLATSFGSFLAPAANASIDILDGLVSTLSFIGEGIGLVIDGITPLIGKLLEFTTVGEGWKLWNDEINDTNSYLSSLANVFSDIDLARAYFIQGALTGFENLRYGAEVSFVSLKGSFGIAVDGMTELFADFVGVVAGGLDGVPFMEDAATELKKFEGSVRDSSTATEDLAAELVTLKDEHVAAIDQIEIITGEMKGYALSSNAAKGVTKKLSTEVDNLGEASGARGTSSDVEDLSNEIYGLEVAASTFLNDIPQKWTDLDVAIDESGKAVGEYGETSDRVSGEVNQHWTTATEGIQDSLGTFFRDGLDGWDSFTDSIENLFKDMIAEMLAAWAISGIAGIFDGDDDYFDGFTMDAFTGGGSFGGSSSTSGSGTQVPQSETVNSVTNAAGDSLGLTEAQTQGGLNAAAGVYNIYGGYQAFENGDEVGGTLQTANGALQAYNGYQQYTGGAQYTGAGANALGFAGSAYGLYNSIEQGDAVGTVINGYQTYQSGAALYSGLTSGGTATGAGMEGVALGSEAAATGSALGVAAGWAAIAIAADQLLLDGKIGDEGFKVWDERKEDVRSGAFGVEKAFLSEGDNFLGFAKGLFSAQGEDSLSYEQLERVQKQLEKGEQASYQLTDSAAFVGTFNDETSFFKSDGNADLEEVERIMEENFGITNAAGLVESGLLKVVDKERGFEENSDAIITEVLASIASVEIGFSDAEVSMVESMGGAFSAMDSHFDSYEDSGLSVTEKVTQAFMDTYGATQAEADLWLETSGVTAERWAHFFDTATGDVLNSVVGLGVQVDAEMQGIGTMAEDAADLLATSFDKQTKVVGEGFVDLATSAMSSMNGLEGYLSGIDIGEASGTVNITESYQTVTKAASVAPPSLDVGTPYVKSDGIAMIHKGEAVLTAEQNREYQGGRGKDQSVLANAVMQTNARLDLLISSLDQGNKFDRARNHVQR